MADTVGSAVNEIQSAPDTFTNWDKCMEKSYCKYPAIVGIVIGALIAISIIWCCVRCCCCGLSCCCGCLSCFNSCCPSGRGRKRSKYAEPPVSPYPQPNPYMGYVPHTHDQPSSYSGPSTASFNLPRGAANGDSLPLMPTWKDGKLEESARHGDPATGSQETGVILSPGARTRQGGYSELRDDDHISQQPGQYRGTSTTHPYGSDLGAQSFLSTNPPREPSLPQFQPDGLSAAPNPYRPMSHGASYPAQMPVQARPPSFLQVGRRPMNGSLREV